MKSVKILIIGICLAFTSISVINVNAQSGRERPSRREKMNQRPAESSPSPTPSPTVEPVNSSVIDDGDVIKVDTQLVTIPVRVMNKNGRFVGGLVKENFRVFEDGVEKEIAMFSNEQQPFTVALVLDMSHSTKFKIAEIQSAAIAFIDQLRPQDKVMVISFDQEVHMLCEATNDRKAIYRAIKSTKIEIGTSLYEAVDLTINARMNRIEGRKAIILFTDGVDTTSMRANSMNNLGDAMELDALIYPIRYDTYADVQNMKNKTTVPLPPILSPPIPVPTTGQPSSKGTTPEEYENARRYLEELASRTGGTIHLASTAGNLADVYTKIASELREFYSLGIYPDDVKVGKTRKLKVKVDQVGLAVRARDNYVVGKKGAKSK
ncbi:MAG: VWA domain-containing protein [Pyrinomonadaceae bacterium]